MADEPSRKQLVRNQVDSLMHVFRLPKEAETDLWRVLFDTVPNGIWGKLPEDWVQIEGNVANRSLSVHFKFVVSEGDKIDSEALNDSIQRGIRELQRKYTSH